MPAGVEEADRRGREPRHLALYGSLRRGTRRHAQFGLPAALQFLGTRWIRGTLYDLGPYPGLVPGPHDAEVELYRIVHGDVLRRLDAYEGFDPADPRSEYVRRAIAVPLLRDRPAPRCRAWIYWFNGDPAGCPVIRSWPRDSRR